MTPQPPMDQGRINLISIATSYAKQLGTPVILEPADVDALLGLANYQLQARTPRTSLSDALSEARHLGYWVRFTWDDTDHLVCLTNGSRYDGPNLAWVMTSRDDVSGNGKPPEWFRLKPYPELIETVSCRVISPTEGQGIIAGWINDATANKRSRGK